MIVAIQIEKDRTFLESLKPSGVSLDSVLCNIITKDFNSKVKDF